MRLVEEEGPANSIYLDNQATTPTDPRVLQSMLAFLDVGSVGNPHSEHYSGRRAAEAVEAARAQVADLIGAMPEEIVFTSGATEANNIAIQGIASAKDRRGDHVITCATEHTCVLDSALWLREKGFEVEVLSVDEDGMIDIAHLTSRIREDTAFVSVMAANNEIGVIHPVAEIADICRSKRVPFHTDAAQAIGKIALDVSSVRVDLMSISGHKIYAPIGIGALFIAEDSPTKPEPLFRGGGQERGFRPGTVAAHLAVALGTAAKIAKENLEVDAERASNLRTRFLEIVRSRFNEVVINGERARRLPGSLSLTIPGIDADHLVGSLQPRIAVSTGAACSAGTLAPSHVLRAIGLSDELADGTVRIGFGRFNTTEDAETAALFFCEAIEKIRGQHPSNNAAA